MKKVVLVCMLVTLLAVGLGIALGHSEAPWAGVDDTVVERFAAEAGRAPRKPFIDTTRGDVALFVFLVGGAAGGFMAGYCFRELFPPGEQP